MYINVQRTSSKYKRKASIWRKERNYGEKKKERGGEKKAEYEHRVIIIRLLLAWISVAIHTIESHFYQRPVIKRYWLPNLLSFLEREDDDKKTAEEPSQPEETVPSRQKPDETKDLEREDLVTRFDRVVGADPDETFQVWHFQFTLSTLRNTFSIQIVRKRRIITR